MDLRHQRSRSGQNRCARRKALLGIVGERGLQRYVRRSQAEAIGIEPLGRKRVGVIGQRFPHGFPGIRFFQDRRGAAAHLDREVGDDVEPLVRPVELEPRHRISERIDLFAAARRRGRDLDCMPSHRLPLARPRHQVKQLVRVHDLSGVVVGRPVEDRIVATAHVLTVWISSPVCEKCRAESRSESWPAASATRSRCAATVRRASAPSSPAPSTDRKSA